MRKTLSIVIALAITFAGLQFLAAPARAADSGTELSPYGDSTMQDVASCLRTANQLDVFYLIDNSKSLGPDSKSGSKGTDPGFLRADIVAQDIQRWSDILAIQPSVKIRVAGSFFAAKASPLAGWTDLTVDNAKSVASSFRSKIRSKSLDFYTNWTAGLEDAYSNLQDSPAECKALVWFTDGGLWSADPRSASLKDLSTLCGPSNTATKISASASTEGLMARIRRSHINVFGIMLSPSGSAGATGEADEDYYKSLMQPLVEETGPAITSIGTLPSGQLVCGEKANPETRDYATGAYLKAVSAAQIAYSFLLLNSKVAGGTAQVGDPSGKFWLDPGIKSFEVLTSAKNWRILDADGKVVKTSSSAQFLGTTGRVVAPLLAKPQEWAFKSDAPFTVVVYPELYLSLHDNAVFAGRANHITGQFVSNLKTGEPANLSTFTSANIGVQVNGSNVKASITPSGVFELDKYTPKIGDQALKIKATLRVKTAHHPDLAPLSFELSQPVLQSQSLPSVSNIAFKKPLIGSKDSAVSAIRVAGPSSGGPGTVCFSNPRVMADNQDQTSGRATERGRSWTTPFQGLDQNGCITVNSGSSKVVKSAVGNQVQADSVVQLLYNYKLAAGDGSQVKDSQSVSLKTQRNTQGGLFWLWFAVLSLLSLVIPYGVLYIISAPAARIYSSRGLDRASVPFTYYIDSKYVVNNSGTTAFDSVEASKAFVQPDRSIPESGVTSYSDGQTGVTVTAKRSRWPLNPPLFTFTPSAGSLAVPVGASADSGKISRTSSRLSNGKLADLAFVVLEPEAATKAASLRQVSGELVIFNGDLSGLYAGILSTQMTKPAVSQNIDMLLAAKPQAVSTAKPQKAKKGKSGDSAETANLFTATPAYATEENAIPAATGFVEPGSSTPQSTYDPYSDI